MSMQCSEKIEVTYKKRFNWGGGMLLWKSWVDETTIHQKGLINYSTE